MALATLVKIGGINNLSDARYSAGMGVEFMGFDLRPDSENYISPEQFGAITGWVSGVKYIGEISMPELTQLTDLIDQYQLDYVQITIPDPTQQLGIIPLPLIVKIDQPEKSFISECLQKYASITEYFLIEPETPLSEELLNWCNTQAKDYPLLLGSNLTKEYVKELGSTGFRGVALSGGNEIRPGFGNFDEIADILEALEIED